MKFLTILFFILIAVPTWAYAEQRSMTSADLNDYVCESSFPGTKWGDKKYFKAADLATATALAALEYNRKLSPDLFSLVVRCKTAD